MHIIHICICIYLLMCLLSIYSALLVCFNGNLNKLGHGGRGGVGVDICPLKTSPTTKHTGLFTLAKLTSMGSISL